jgi:hypothetical protein
MRGDRLVQLLARGLVPALRRIQHAEVVVRLGQLGKILRQTFEGRHRFLRARQFAEDHAALEAHLRIARVLLQKRVGTLERRFPLPLVHQRGDLRCLALGHRNRGRRLDDDLRLRRDRQSDCGDGEDQGANGARRQEEGRHPLIYCAVILTMQSRTASTQTRRC